MKTGRKVNFSQHEGRVDIIYHDWESAEIAKKYLNEKQFLGRDLKISVDLRKNMMSEEEHISREIERMTPSEKLETLSYLKNLRQKEKTMF